MQGSPAAMHQSANLFVYTMNNPIMWNDPSGESAALALLTVLAVVNVIANVVSNNNSSNSSSNGGSSGGGGSNWNANDIGNTWPGSLISFSVRNGSSTVTSRSGRVDLGRGWIVRIEQHGVGPGMQQHAHVINSRSRQEWIQNIDGSPHDKNRNPPGNPPNRVLRELYRKTGWDWRQNQDDWISKISMSTWDCGTTQVLFPDGRVASYMPIIGGPGIPSRNALLSLYQNSESNSMIGPQPLVPVVPMPSPQITPHVPVRVTFPMRFPIVVRAF